MPWLDEQTGSKGWLHKALPTSKAKSRDSVLGMCSLPGNRSQAAAEVPNKVYVL